MIDLKVKLKTGRKNKKEELVLAVENELLYMGFYDQNIKEYITFNLKSIPYFDLAPFLRPKGPGINKVKGLVPDFRSTL